MLNSNIFHWILFTALILTTHDIFCLGFDRDLEGWEVPRHQPYTHMFKSFNKDVLSKMSQLAIGTSGKSRYSVSAPMSSSRGIFRGAALLQIKNGQTQNHLISLIMLEVYCLV